MSEAKEIEKKSLEAHVELCAERYSNLELRLDKLDEDHKTSNGLLRELHDMIQRLTDKRTDQIMGWGVGIIAALVGAVCYLLINFVIK
jgi:chromosome segregation ATPase